MTDATPPRPGTEDADARLAAALDAVFAEFPLEPAWRLQVRDLIDRDDATWRSCCGGACDPCVFTLGHIVDAVRARLRVGG